MRKAAATSYRLRGAEKASGAKAGSSPSETHGLCFRVFKMVGITLTFLSILFLISSQADSQPAEQTVFMATQEQLKAGFAVEVDGLPGFVQYSGQAETGKTVDVYASGLTKPVGITVIPPDSNTEQTLILPILIEDKSLARGVTLNLITPEGRTAQMSIPPKRVFLSLPFTIPVTENLNPDFGRTNRNLILQIIPKITKKAQVNVDNTAVDGLVADIRYEGIAYLKLRDLLNRTNRRDMSGTFFIGKYEDYRWHVITENLLEKYDTRNMAIMKNQRLGGEMKSQWRLDRLNVLKDTKLGLNLEYKEDKSSVLFGNIDRRVKDKTHGIIGYGDENLRFLTRFEGIEFYSPASLTPGSVRVDRSGYQLQLRGEDNLKNYSGRFGNLKVQDFEDEGEIDDYFNFEFNYSRLLGEQGMKWDPRTVTFSGDTSLTFWGRGSASWLRGELNYNIGYKTDYLLYFRYNNDFARITGRPERALWESVFVSMMRNRNYFKRNDKLAKYGLESIHVDFDFSREGKGVHFARKTRFGISRFMKVWKYDLPVELYVETEKYKVFRPGMGISIRRYL